MIKNNIPENETRTMTATLLVQGGIDTAVSHDAIPGYLINNLENALEAIGNYITERKSEGKSNGR